MARKPADKVGLMLRFDEALRRQLERAAKAHNRSMNAEIVQRLKTSFQMEGLEAFLAGKMASAAEKGADRAVVSFLQRLYEKGARLVLDEAHQHLKEPAASVTVASTDEDVKEGKR